MTRRASPGIGALAAVGAVGRMAVGTLRMTLAVRTGIAHRTVAARCVVAALLVEGALAARLLLLVIGARREIAALRAIAPVLDRTIAALVALMLAFGAIDCAAARIRFAADRLAMRSAIAVAALAAVGAVA